MNDVEIITQTFLLVNGVIFFIFNNFFHFLFLISAIIQDFDTDVGNEYVIIGNDALLKCKIPSFVTDFVSIISWTYDYKGVSKEIPNKGNKIVARIVKYTI